MGARAGPRINGGSWPVGRSERNRQLPMNRESSASLSQILKSQIPNPFPPDFVVGL
jgi:hypothetical protein